MKKGFTLIEVVGVIVLLAIIMLIAFPTITSLVGNTKNQISDATLRLINTAADDYMENGNYFITDGRDYCFTLSELATEGFLTTPLKDVMTGEDVDLTQKIIININEVNGSLKKEYHLAKNCN